VAGAAAALTGSPAAAEPPDAEAEAPIAPTPEASLALLRDHVRHTFSYNTLSLTGHLIGAAIVLAMFASVAPAATRWAWGGAFAVLWVVRAAMAWRFARDEPPDVPGLLVRLRAWQVGVLAAGAMWGAAALLFGGLGNTLHQIALVVVVYSYCVACVPILAPQFRLYLIFVSLVFLPAIGSIAAQGTSLDWQVAGTMSAAMAMTMLLGRTYKRAFDASIRLKLANGQLADQLRAEKAAADEARRVAETANRGKTQFFAAASHDLRQPLHAMGLFAEALRQRVREPEVAQLVHSINESVGALEGLFSQLLDITKIDSGGVDVKPAHVKLEDLFRKLRLHFEPAAFEKGLELRFRGGRHVVFADPLLVERVLRNLVANAIRYTEDGTVLVACRRRGAKVLLQVWDTGPGIRLEDQVRIFEEFVQVEGAAPVEPQERKGLGLGLAIVKRLSALLGAPLVLRSTPGRGSVFSIELAPGTTKAAAEQAMAASAAAPRLPMAVTLAGRTVLVVEDEPAVREGLEVLLRDWGAATVAHDGTPSLRAWLDAQPPDAAPPSLLVTDWRLSTAERAETGLDAIRHVRARFPTVPAIVVSGSTTTDLEKEAVAHDFHLLVKPVLPNKLRAMIGFKLKPG
jgi:signal transduction histidine kinase